MRRQTDQALRVRQIGLIMGSLFAMVLSLLSTDVGLTDDSGPSGRPQVHSAIPTYAPISDLDGGFVITGSETMQPMLSQLVSRFRQIYPKTKIAIQTQGTEKGYKQFVSDQAQIRRGDGFYSGQQVSGSAAVLASSRDLTSEEMQNFRARHGYDPIGVPVAMGAVVIYVNKDNPIQGVSLEQLDAIFGRDRKRGYLEDISTWGQVGVQGKLAQQSIHLYGRDAGSATRTIMKTVALLDGEFKGTIQEQPGPATQIIAIGKDPAAIGYVGTGFRTSAVRPLPLAERAGMPFVEATPESVTNGSYPMGRFLYLYAKKDSGSDWKPMIREFLRFVNSREGQQIVTRSGVFPLTSEQVAKNLQTVGDSLSAASQTITAGVNH